MMKKILQWGMMVVALALATSCSNRKVSDLLDRVPANTEYTLVGDVETILESAGGEIKDGELKLPSSIENELPSYMSNELDDLNELIKEAGVNPDAACMAISFKLQMRPVFIVKIDDEKKFLSYLDDNRFRERGEEDGLTMYVMKDEGDWYTMGSFVGVKDSYAYILSNVYMHEDMEFNPERALTKFVAAADEESMGSTAAGKYIAETNAGGFIFHMTSDFSKQMREYGTKIPSIANGYSCLRANVEEDNLTFNFKMFDEDGKERKAEDYGTMANLDGRIEKEALTYLGKDENMVMAVSLKDVKWNKVISQIEENVGLSRNDEAMLDIVKGYLQKIDGTVAVGFGIKGGLDGIVDIDYGHKPFEAMSFTVVLQTKENKSKGIVKDLKEMMDNYGMPYESTASGFTVQLDKESKIFVEAKGNYVIFANHKISQSVNDAVKSFDFSEYMAAGAIVFNKDNKMMRDLGIENDVILSLTSDAETCEVTAKVEIKGGKGKGFVAKAFGIILDVISNQKAIDRKYNARRDEIRGNSYDDYYGEYAVEETYVVEPDYYGTDSVVAVEEW